MATKADLWEEYSRLCNEKRVYLNGVYQNSKKSEIQNAIKCLVCSDSKLDDYMTVIRLKYPATADTIARNKTDFKHHSYNRLYIYNTARLVLS